MAASGANGNNGASKPRLRAVISDVHGNLEALTAVLKDIRDQGAEEIVCLGDVVGYGPNPVECLKIIRRVCTWCLCGNHDAALFMSHAVGFNEGAAKAVAWQRRHMQPHFFSMPGKVARWRWLEGLSAKRVEGNVTYVHASPRDPIMEYVLEEDFQDMGFGPSDKATEIFAAFDWLCFVGHSHRPGVATHDMKWIKPADLTDLTYVLPKGKKTLVNIGAVGQPRDKNKDSCYVLYDGEKIRYRRVAYDLEKTAAKIRQVPQLEKRFAERLAKGL
ncbi:MAG TPA: metallophosphoesterase family protein [Planctomycetota bacterium]|jgi:diadenosine tetraphosphatase ApaH/serine/threonine PP2A family protein phosphatase